jgi:hypothetical protein
VHLPLHGVGDHDGAPKTDSDAPRIAAGGTA